MTRAQNKAARLQEIEQLLLAHPKGLTQSEIARRLGVNRSTVSRNMIDLQAPVYEEERRYFIDREAYLVNVRFNLHETLALHLAARLLATRMERQNPHAAAALRKLSVAIDRLAPHLAGHMKQSANAMDDPTQKQDPNFLRNLEVLTLAWAQNRKTHIWHCHEDKTIHEYTFSPYFMEPYAIGQAVHVIGWREPPGAIRTLKVERLLRVELLREEYSIPPDFDPAELLKDAWGIWFTENEPVEVVLQFSRRVARRVRETRWHRSEQVTENDDGSLLWRARIAEPQEMMPWIRGWGADVEVIEPAEMREKLSKEIRTSALLYFPQIIKTNFEQD